VRAHTHHVMTSSVLRDIIKFIKIRISCPDRSVCVNACWRLTLVCVFPLCTLKCTPTSSCPLLTNVDSVQIEMSPQDTHLRTISITLHTYVWHHCVSYVSPNFRSDKILYASSGYSSEQTNSHFCDTSVHPLMYQQIALLRK
jgi:hypothetical protein